MRDRTALSRRSLISLPWPWRPPATDVNVPVIGPTSPLSWCREPADKSDVGASGTPHCCHEHETQIPLGEAPPDGNDRCRGRRGKQVDTLVERCAGLDVHKDSVTACVRVPDGHGGRQVETRRFTTTTAGLGLLAEWLASFGVTRVGMESTGWGEDRAGHLRGRGRAALPAATRATLPPDPVAQALGAAAALGWAGGAGQEPGSGGGPGAHARAGRGPGAGAPGRAGGAGGDAAGRRQGSLGAGRAPVLTAGRVWRGAEGRRPAPGLVPCRRGPDLSTGPSVGVVAAAGLAIVRS
jgi:hypothetical protein